MCRKLALFGMLAALVLSSGVEAGQEASKPLVASGSYITLEKGKSVYVVGVEAASRDLSLTRANLEIERKAKEQFRKKRVFKIAQSLQEADFVFLVVLDAQSALFDESALVISPDSYVELGNNIDALRVAAIWQESAHFDRKKRLTTMATLGFKRVSIAKGLVNRFHEDAIGKRFPLSTRQAVVQPERASPPDPASQPRVPEDMKADSGLYMGKRLGVWSRNDAEFILGDHLRSGETPNQEGSVSANYYVYPDPTGLYREIELGFSGGDGAMSSVRLVPWNMTWQQCKALWGEDASAKSYESGNIVYSYRDRRLDVLVNSLGQVLKIGLY
jgi:hypothetical protein